MTMDTAISLLALLLGGGLGTGLWRYTVAHERRHQKIEDRLEWGLESFERNDKAHERIEEKIDDIDETLEAVAIAVREILIISGKRTPGQGLNGK